MPVCIAAVSDVDESAVVAADRLKSEQRDALLPQDIDYVRIKVFDEHTVFLSSCTSEETEAVFARAKELAAGYQSKSAEALAECIRVAQGGVPISMREQLHSTVASPCPGSGPDGTPRPWSSQAEFLVVGMEGTHPQVYRINEAGKHSLESIGYTVIGEGERTSWMTLVMLGCYRMLPLAHVVYYVYEAKKGGECYVRVGLNTDMAIVDCRGVRFLDERVVEILDNLSRQRKKPWMPEEGPDMINQALAGLPYHRL